jgi:hypothetical protein
MAKGLSAPIVAPTIVRYTFVHILQSGRKADNIMDISIGGSGLADRDAVIDDFNSHIAGYWQDGPLYNYANTTTFEGVHWLDLDSLGGRTGFLGPAGGHPTTGNGSTEPQAPNVAYLIHKNTTAQRGQRSGRCYIGDVREDRVDRNGVVSAPDKTSLNAQFATFKAAIDAYDTPPHTGGQPCALRVVHVHKVSKLDPTTWTWSSSDITSFSCDNKVASQRRRLR